MEIHKLKPIHNWRDFLKELGTIVLGIVIAIGLEQLVEYVNWQHEVAAGRQAIIAEIYANDTNYFAVRIATASCVERQIDEAADILTALVAGRKTGGMTRFRPPPGSLLRDSEWESERASQVLTHFPRAELALMSRYYAHLSDFRGWRADEGNAWRSLRTLQDPPARTPISDLIRLRTDLNAARSSLGIIITNAKRQLRISKQLGVPDARVDPMRAKNYCTMSDADYGRYRSAQDLL